MAKQALSPEEIDCLSAATPAFPEENEDRVPASPASRLGPASNGPQDRRLSDAERHTLQTLRGPLQRLCLGLTRSLSELLRAETGVALATVEKTLLGQFVWGRQEPTCFATLAASDNSPPLMLDVSLAVLFPWSRMGLTSTTITWPPMPRARMAIPRPHQP